MGPARASTAALACALTLAGLSACGETSPGAASRSATATTGRRGDPRPDIVASATAPTGGGTDRAASGSQGSQGASGLSAAHRSQGASGGAVKEVADPHEAESYPAPASVHHSAATAPAKAGETIVAAGAPSDEEVRHELQQMAAVQRSANSASKLKLTPVPGGESVGGNGTIPIPTNVPEAIQKVVAGANAIADFPYVFGGGHASFIDNAYDCSGSVSYALAAGGLLSAPETSGELESWGAPGPGKYITVFANAGHTYMYVDGILYDTAGRSGVYASRWQVQPVDNSGYAERHYPGL
jgi:cell wall-associated NlpC family hydrolase